jgi:Tol biopolymer transport system component
MRSGRSRKKWSTISSTWSPDGKELTVPTTGDGTPNIYRHPLDGTPATPITSFKSARIFNFAWSADGKELLLARQRPAAGPRRRTPG